jgi:hypothetical protein
MFYYLMFNNLFADEGILGHFMKIKFYENQISLSLSQKPKSVLIVSHMNLWQQIAAHFGIYFNVIFKLITFYSKLSLLMSISNKTVYI